MDRGALKQGRGCAAAANAVADLILTGLDAMDADLAARASPRSTGRTKNPLTLSASAGQRVLLLVAGAGFESCGHLAAGGGDPATLIRQYADRLQHVHLKDLRTDPFSFVPLGEGELDFADILQALEDVGFDGWAVVELDSYDGDPAVAARISKQHLDQLMSPGR